MLLGLEVVVIPCCFVESLAVVAMDLLSSLLGLDAFEEECFLW